MKRKKFKIWCDKQRGVNTHDTGTICQTQRPWAWQRDWIVKVFDYAFGYISKSEYLDFYDTCHYGTACSMRAIRVELGAPFRVNQVGYYCHTRGAFVETSEQVVRNPSREQQAWDEIVAAGYVPGYSAQDDSIRITTSDWVEIPSGDASF